MVASPKSAAGQELAAVEAETGMLGGGQGAAPETVLLIETEAGLMTEIASDAGGCCSSSFFALAVLPVAVFFTWCFSDDAMAFEQVSSTP